MKQTILVTGGMGYIGSHTVAELLSNPDLETITIDNHSNSSPAIHAVLQALSGRSFRHYPIDLCNKKDLDIVFKENPSISGIIHFAALKSVPESVAQPLKYYRNNLDSLANLLELALEYNIPKFIFSSSCSVYGNIASLPVNEATPLGLAASPYAYTKQVGERMIADVAAKATGFQSICLRYFNPVGAHPSGEIGESPVNTPTNLVPVITQAAAGLCPPVAVFGSDYPTRDGTCIRDYVHVCDVAKAHLLALTYQSKNNFSVFNLGSGSGVSVLEALQAFEQATGTKVPYRIGERRTGDVVAVYSDTKRSKEHLGWEPRFSLEEMMATAWKWQQKLISA